MSSERGASASAAPAAAASSDPAQAGIKLEYVSATGEGCPAGSYTPSLSQDGRLFSVQLTKLRPMIAPDEQAAAASCRLAIVVSAPVGTSFQVDEFSYGGYAYLEEGVTAELTTNYYFQANQAISEQVQSSLTGPVDRNFTIEDKSNGSLWSPCGVTGRQTLNVQLHVGLRNGTPPRDGTFEINEAVGIALKWRTCDASGATTGTLGTPSEAMPSDDDTTDADRSSADGRGADDDHGSDDGHGSDDHSSDERWDDSDSDSDSDEGGWWWWGTTWKLGILHWLR